MAYDDVHDTIVDVIKADWFTRDHPNPPDPPSRHARPELHVTNPPVHRPVKRDKAQEARTETLPVFHALGEATGWRAFLPSPKVPMAISTTGAIYAIEVFFDKAMRAVCREVEIARGELWERARDYDLMEAEYRSGKMLRKQNGMLFMRA